jgi:two-component system, sporulation sensor kinase D
MQCGRVGSRLLLKENLGNSNISEVFSFVYRMQWTDRIRQVKIILVIAAILIAVASLVVSHILTRDLEIEERNKVEVWAEAMRSLSTADENTDLNLVLKVINENHTIPVIVMDSNQRIQTFRNINIRHKDQNEILMLGKQLLRQGRYIRIQLGDTVKSDYIDVCYDDSVMLKRLEFYPFVQLGVVLIFVIIAIFALLTSKRAEQNKVWVGLSKETAHQLGTPISSLMAWSEILKENYPQDELIPELDKDVKRLQLIADRFSKIGSLPELVPTSLNEVLNHVIDYMDRRTSKNIKIIKEFPAHDIILNLNSSLFEWVIENISKNAVDAMGGEKGSITLSVEETEAKVIIDIADTGKGIKKKDIRNVFRPGFTTKKRGWGLGLCLAKRIVEEYHKGKIWVKSSEVGKGTTFRIELKK